MDFSLDEDLVSLADLARTIFTDLARPERIREVETSETRTDDQLWQALGQAGLLGLVVGEDADGAGLGLDALCVVLEEQGRTVAPVPLWSAGVAALALTQHGTDSQQALLPGLASGADRLTVALEEFAPATAQAPLTQARADGERWLLTGTKAAVPTPAGASGVLVAATGPEGPAVYLVATDAEGVEWEQSITTTHDLAANLVLTDAPAELVPVPLAELIAHATLALAAIQVGVADGAMRLAATYLSGREQFGRPLATFQAVAHQLADCWIDVDAMRSTLWQGLESLRPADAADGASNGVAAATTSAVLTAKWWCNQAGLDVVHRTQHLHGGIGVDVDYPVHRHFLWGRQIANTLGGSSAALADLGRLLTATR
ncbi:acyl-CoA dehydrogenase [Nocardioides daedukensis]|uniref:Acyl-CoA dehydrogenase n=1 Tax=Nocardioides daedukensis TaxID=634462 RepID=A0A7Y9S4H7_9ACTN|nr:acyl-CoA dehydrogenase family protein [Nocardioides daedukensis]NYG59933.1 acyl-CoA dehydrogenase [Nocardioides daedukensis]